MLLTIDIGSKYIHLVEGEYKNKKLHIKREIKALTPAECISEGQITDFSRLKIALKEILKEHGIKTQKVSLTIEAEQLIEREVIIPRVKEKEIYTVLEGQLVQMIGIEEPYIITYTDVTILDEKMQKVHFAALPQTMIADYKRLLEELKMKPVGIQMHQTAIGNFVKETLTIEKGQAIVADIGNRYLNLHLIQNGERTFSQTKRINTDQCERTLLSVRRIQEENKDFYDLNLSQEALEEDIILDTTMRPYLTQIVQEIIRMMQYQLTIDQTKSVQEIYLCGGMSQLKGLQCYIEEYIGLPVKTVEKHPLSCNAIGALWITQDFLRRYQQVEKERRTLSKRTVGRLVVLGLLMLGIMSSMLMLVGLKTTALAQSQQIENFLASPDIREKLEIAAIKENRLTQMRSYTKAVHEATQAIESMLPMTKEVWMDLNSRMPNAVKINKVSYQKGELILTCEAITKDDINLLVRALRLAEWVHDVTYSGYVKTEVAYQFQLAIAIAQGGESK
ncbi:MAG: pilus assembly protein PilM [Cellulosilyticaceae bacterium]